MKRKSRERLVSLFDQAVSGGPLPTVEDLDGMAIPKRLQKTLSNQLAGVFDAGKAGDLYQARSMAREGVGLAIDALGDNWDLPDPARNMTAAEIVASIPRSAF